ncbi:Uncharacterised protein [Salmonella enterica subsp. enterica serovar Typhi]|nr:Uncharacterised protein [Salmonella enterica subsp. enterica serovar Typhi]CGX35411.1 Uncharacterised protein [Salmonella enterica subsp. enterica serovar Typhi]CHA98013.1 Uncharacterised protein [Salmonella enterica subsp. enterica serovar Typhi]CHB44477.1 Uncharacterised protein [Salmonella enterica subsp. enterica serovar Typhi]CHC19355.1 Uncharacterised protein [Salmonella enterica subsp. enterica serovar Typhi]
MFRAVNTLRGAVFHLNIDPTSLSLNDELLAHALHLFHILFTDRFTHTICFGHREAGQQSCRVHRLFLIQNHAVGFRGKFVQYRVQRLWSHEAFGHGDIVVQHAGLNRARSEECGRGDNGFEAHWFNAAAKIFKQLAHGAGLQLEYALRVPCSEPIQNLAIVQWDRIEIDVIPGALFDVAFRAIQQIERCQTENVQLNQPHRLAVTFIECNTASVATQLDGRALYQWNASDDHPRCVTAKTTHQALQLTRRFERFRVFRGVFVQAGQLLAQLFQ